MIFGILIGMLLSLLLFVNVTHSYRNHKLSMENHIRVDELLRKIEGL